MKRSAAREQRGADHALGAADDSERAERSLVNVARTAGELRRQFRGERIPIEAMTEGRRGGSDVEAERMDADVTAQIHGLTGQQPRLQRDERRGRSRANRRSHRNAGVGIQAGGDVKRENRRPRRIGTLDERCIGGGERARETDAEQPVDDERAVESFRPHGNRRAPWR
jgi:hypothetical protein